MGKTKKSRFSCKLCASSFKYNRTLRHHVSVAHPLHSVDEIAPLNFLFCKHCRKKFLKLEKLQSHIDEQHTVKSDDTLPKKLTFESYESFLNWKAQEERNNLVYFRKIRSAQGKSGYTSHCFICHRSGKFHSDSRNIRRLKKQGSCKIGKICPAKMNVRVLSSGVCELRYRSVHVGHDNDNMQHFRIGMTERKKIADEIAKQIPFNTILDNVRDNVSNNSIERIHLLNLQDIRNIERSFNLNASKNTTNEIASVESWVQEMQESNDPCVLYFKPIGIIDEFNMSKNDFNLVIMTRSQEEMLKKFGNDVICISSTDGTANYKFMLTAIMVLDDLRQGFPCAFFISSKIDIISILRFFEKIRTKVGRINTNIFFSDIDSVFYDAWVTIMGTPNTKLYLSYSVESVWHNKIQEKIRNKTYQEKTSKMLNSLLIEKNQNTFNEMLKIIFKCLEETSEINFFSKYFKECFFENTKCWAYCYQQQFRFNYNIVIENIFNKIKQIYKRKKNNKLEIAISNLMKFVRSIVFDRVCILTKGKITNKIENIKINHENSLEINYDNVVDVDTGWLVHSDGTSYLVEKILENCDCKLNCELCEACVHQYNCNCSDGEKNMCKHIHATCLYLNKNLNIDDVDFDDDDDEEEDNDDIGDEENDYNDNEYVQNFSNINSRDVVNDDSTTNDDDNDFNMIQIENSKYQQSETFTDSNTETEESIKFKINNKEISNFKINKDIYDVNTEIKTISNSYTNDILPFSRIENLKEKFKNILQSINSNEQFKIAEQYLDNLIASFDSGNSTKIINSNNNSEVDISNNSFVVANSNNSSEVVNSNKTLLINNFNEISKTSFI